jgi:DNA-binding response OmpR family regulator
MENQVTKQPAILVVEPDPLMLTAIAAVLDSRGYRCFLARDVSVASQATDQMPFDLIVLSLGEDLSAATQAAQRLRANQRTEGLPVIFIAPRLNPEWIGPLNAVGGVSCLSSPFEPETLLDLVDKAVWMPHLAVARLAPPPAHFEKSWVRL